jgi:hypothetical protein
MKMATTMKDWSLDEDYFRHYANLERPEVYYGGGALKRKLLKA